MTRIKSSFGTCFVNNGIESIVDEQVYKLDNTRKYYLFDVIPMGAPRMTQSDKWRVNPNHLDPNKRQRVAVTKYFEFKNNLLAQAKQLNFEIGETLEALYLIPMPDSWSNKKKDKMNGLPCKAKPDTDNITKGIKDTFSKNDSNIWKESAEKRWAYKGSVIIFK